MTTSLPQCFNCKNYDFDKDSCPAFPDGIPDIIFSGEWDHTVEHPKDNGIRFKEMTTEELEAKL